MEETDKPRLASGCRLHIPEQGDPVLLVPEGALRLLGPAREILELVDGQRTVREFITSLAQQYSMGDPVVIGAETNTLLERLRQRGVVKVAA
jgi:pyrroloquinoline quinone biosynthesis protein D